MYSIAALSVSTLDIFLTIAGLLALDVVVVVGVVVFLDVDVDEE